MAKSAAKHSHLHSPSHSTESMNTASITANSPITKFIEQLTGHTHAEAKERAVYSERSDEEELITSTMATPQTATNAVPAMPMTSRQRAIAAAVNYTRHICTDEETHMQLIHLLFCLEQAVVG